MAISSTITAEQDAPPTGLVLYGSRYNPIVVLLYKVEMRACLKITFVGCDKDPAGMLQSTISTLRNSRRSLSR